uniref:Transcription initiation factor IIF subunit alpha n=1 Tax=Aceria tosichella TaxID=561515 RepID=A0A6G1SML5_9ACAR
MDESKVILAPNSGQQKLCVFKLHRDDNVSWAEAKMKRENDYQPWQIKLGSGRAARRFRAIKEGGVGENASYFIFYKPKNSTSDTFEVCPVDEWYNVSATQRYKTLTAEEAEQKFEQRHKTLNYFSVMHMKKNGESGEEKSSGDSKAFKITEMDDWENSGDDSSGGSERGDDETGTKKKHQKKSVKKEETEDAPEEGKEDSDEGDFEQREVDYMSDSSSESGGSSAGEKDETDVKGIAEEEALRDLLSTDDEEDEEGSPTKRAQSPLNKSSIVTTDIQQEAEGDGSDDSSDSDDYDVDEDKMDSMFMKKGLPAQLVKQESNGQNSPSASASGASSVQPTVQKQTAATQPTTNASKRRPDNSQASTSSSTQPTTSPPKRHCPAEYSSSAPVNSHERVVEDLIKKYLSRKPMTLRALLKEIKNKLKRMGGSTPEMDDNLVHTIALIINNRLRVEKQKINDTTYLSLKS